MGSARALLGSDEPLWVAQPYRWGGGGPFGWWLDLLGQALSPYQFNPFNINPLRDVLASTIDFECVRCCQRMKLYVAATNVLTNRLRIFTPAELSIDVLLASACLSHLIAGEQVMTGLGARSELDTIWSSLVRLKGLGRACAERCLAESFEQLGESPHQT